jgi:hypothetical protein
MARKAVAAGRCNIRLACQVFSISETCYRYRAKLQHENAETADWLVRLTCNQRNWGFGLCYLYLRNVKAYDQSCFESSLRSPVELFSPACTGNLSGDLVKGETARRRPKR